MTWLKTLLFVCLLILVFVFAALAVNQQQVALSFLRWQTPFTLEYFLVAADGAATRDFSGVVLQLGTVLPRACSCVGLKNLWRPKRAP